MRTVGNTERKFGALNQAWLRWQAGYDYIAGVDADTVLAPDCLQRLEEEMAATPRAGGVMARYTFDQKLGASAMARLLIRMQRLEFASWTADALRRNRKTYVLGGQATLSTPRPCARWPSATTPGSPGTPAPWSRTCS